MKMMIADPFALRDSVSATKDGGGVGESWLKRPIIYPSSLQPSWAVTSREFLCLRWGPSAEMVRLDKPRALGLGRRSLADAQQFGVRAKGDQINEDDVVHHLGALPNFDGKLADEDSERLMTYLTVPFMSIPLVLGLFNRENIGALLDPKLQCLLEWVLFETGCRPTYATWSCPCPVPLPLRLTPPDPTPTPGPSRRRSTPQTKWKWCLLITGKRIHYWRLVGGG
jgi:hypothetical protein